MTTKQGLEQESASFPLQRVSVSHAWFRGPLFHFHDAPKPFWQLSKVVGCSHNALHLWAVWTEFKRWSKLDKMENYSSSMLFLFFFFFAFRLDVICATLCLLEGLNMCGQRERNASDLFFTNGRNPFRSTQGWNHLFSLSIAASFKKRCLLATNNTYIASRDFYVRDRSHFMDGMCVLWIQIAMGTKLWVEWTQDLPRIAKIQE